MKVSWKPYCEGCKKFGVENPYKDEADFNRAYGIDQDTQEPLVIEPKKDYRKAAASLESFIKIAESSKRRRSKPISEAVPKKIRAPRAPKMSAEERKAKNAAYAKAKKAQNLAMGLTSKGKERKPRPVGMTKTQMTQYKAQKMREQRAEWKAQGLNNKGKPFAAKSKEKLLEYAKTYQTKHREKHLAYRREWRAKNKERKNTCTLQEAS